jgi:hypothetical protein
MYVEIGEQMELRAAIQRTLEDLPDDRVREVLDFARFVAQNCEDEGWEQLGRQQFGRAYGPNEPEYTEADLIPESPTP